MSNETKLTAVQLYRLKSLELFKFFIYDNIDDNQWILLEEKLYDELKQLENEQKFQFAYDYAEAILGGCGLSPKDFYYKELENNK